ncbi:hypothetical protein HPB50_023951 [Hyalomma asiaticum]|uniref:Uncharacterized protein n=1 Tax=Hyalomma asiaticum TaxID=266040 RepID=A0ACB7S7L3_HYAAI|nr:hypothetical protein HPB50_023951 [Hyalomma asiaticum]
MFRFPRSPRRQKRWLAEVKRDNWEPTAYSRVCSAHLEDSNFEQRRQDGLRKLRPDAVPTVFPSRTTSTCWKPTEMPGCLVQSPGPAATPQPRLPLGDISNDSAHVKVLIAEERSCNPDSSLKAGALRVNEGSTKICGAGNTCSYGILLLSSVSWATFSQLLDSMSQGASLTSLCYDSDDGFHLADLIGPSLGKSIEEIRDDEEHLEDLLLEEVSPVECDILAYVAGFLLRAIIKATVDSRIGQPAAKKTFAARWSFRTTEGAGIPRGREGSCLKTPAADSSGARSSKDEARHGCKRRTCGQLFGEGSHGEKAATVEESLGAVNEATVLEHRRRTLLPRDNSAAVRVGDPAFRRHAEICPIHREPGHLRDEARRRLQAKEPEVQPATSVAAHDAVREEPDKGGELNVCFEAVFEQAHKRGVEVGIAKSGQVEADPASDDREESSVAKVGVAGDPAQVCSLLEKERPIPFGANAFAKERVHDKSSEEAHHAFDVVGKAVAWMLTLAAPFSWSGKAIGGCPSREEDGDQRRVTVRSKGQAPTRQKGLQPNGVRLGQCG